MHEWVADFLAVFFFSCPSTHKSPEHQFGHRGSTPLETYLSQEGGQLHRHGAPASGIEKLNLSLFWSLKALIIEFERYLQESKLDLNLAALLLSNHNTVFLQTVAYLFVVPSFPKLKSLSDNFTTFIPTTNIYPLPPFSKSERRAGYSQSLFMGWESAKSSHLFTEVNMVMPLLLYHSWSCAKKVQFFLEIFSCWNLFPKFLSKRPHITECGKCQNVIWSDWILIWRSCIWKLRSTLKKLFVFPVCLPLLHEGSHPFFSVLCSKRCLQNSGVSKSDPFLLCDSRILLFSATSVDGTIQLRFKANKK